MSKFLSTLKLKVSKNNLRFLKNSLSDDFDSMKYHLGIIRDNLLNKSSTPELNENLSSNEGKENSLNIAFAVTEFGETASAGDYFTALELGEGLKKLGWQISFLSKNGAKYWYKVDDDVDVIISLIRYIRSTKNNIIK